MKRVLDFIEEQKRKIDESPFHIFLRDQSIPIHQRLSFAPCMAPFVMGFADINKYVLRDESSQDPCQKIINTHTEEDDHHFGMFLKDLQTLGMDKSMTFTGALKELWSEETSRMRQLVYGLTRLAVVSPTKPSGPVEAIEAAGNHEPPKDGQVSEWVMVNPKMRLVLVEAIEAAGNHGFQRFKQVSEEYRKQTGKPLYYFGDPHLALESGHAMGSDNIENKLASLVLTEKERAQALAIVEEVFKLFYAISEEALRYIQRRANRT